MNNILTKIKQTCPPILHIANANMINYTIAWNIQSKKNIPSSIEFASNTAKHRQPGIYLFPSYMGTYHDGHWVTFCIEKYSQTSQKLNLKGWILDPSNTKHQQDILSHVKKLESNIFFNTQIEWIKNKQCVQLQEDECGPRTLLSCFIIGIGTKFGLGLSNTIAEATNLPITRKEHTSFLAREFAYQISQGKEEAELYPKVLSPAFLIKIKENSNQHSKLTSVQRLSPDEESNTQPSNKSNRSKGNNKKRKSIQRSVKKAKTIKKQKIRELTSTNKTEKIFGSANLHKSTNARAITRNSAPLFNQCKDNINNSSSVAPTITIYSNKTLGLQTSNIRSQSKSKQRNIGCNNKSNNNEIGKGKTKRVKSVNMETISRNIQISVPRKKEEVSYNIDTLINISRSDSPMQDTIRKSRINLASLQPGTWLNDEVINAFMSILNDKEIQSTSTQRNYHPSFFFTSFFFTALGTDQSYNYSRVQRWSRRIRVCNNMFQLRNIIIAINISNSHWTIACINFPNQRIEFLDSMGNPGTIFINNLLRYLDDEHKNKLGHPLPNIRNWSLIPGNANIPQQPNSYDCGVFSCIYAEALSRNLHPSNINHIHPNPREWLHSTITSNSLDTQPLSRH